MSNTTGLIPTGDATRGKKRRVRRPLRGFSRRRRGAVIVEFAMVAPIFFLLLFAAVEFARMNMLRHAADNAAYEAARHVVVPGGTSAEATAEATALLGVFGFQGATISINPTSLDDDDQSVTVTVDLPVNQNAWVFPRFTGNKTVRGTSTLRTERYRPI
ncbi:MAG: pilus assembly protein [Planctomycetota bacterium]|nr:pilus assembly protein [Planctomycetota bacterium]